ncbi:hypothetical protein Scel_21290 [Streptomyces cellostaticus]|nr:hypothetical protein Scel_21290 [Streptomyces cellostaticus]
MVAASEYAGALPATAITTVSNVPRTLACRPLPLLLLMVVPLSGRARRTGAWPDGVRVGGVDPPRTRKRGGLGGRGRPGERNEGGDKGVVPSGWWTHRAAECWRTVTVWV